MSIRQGVTAAEEAKLKALISKGVSWEEIAARCAPGDDKVVPLLQDVNLEYVRKNIYLPLVKKLEEAKKAGHSDILSHERAIAAKKAEAKKAKESL